MADHSWFLLVTISAVISCMLAYVCFGGQDDDDDDDTRFA